MPSMANGENSGFMETGESSGAMENGESSEAMEIGENSEAMETGENSEAMEIGENSGANEINLAAPNLTVSPCQDFPDIEIKCSESVTFGEVQRDKMKKPKRGSERKSILIGVCALLNSGGGVMTVDVGNSSYDYRRESRGLEIEKQLEKLVGPGFEDMIEIIPQINKVQIRKKIKDRVKRKAEVPEGEPAPKRHMVSSARNGTEQLEDDDPLMAESLNKGENVQIGESLHVERDRERIAERVYDLVNSGGADVTVDVTNLSSAYQEERRGLDIEDHLKMSVCSGYKDMLDFIPQVNRVHIFVRSWQSGANRPRLCSIDSGLCERRGSLVTRISPDEVPVLLEKRTQHLDEGIAPVESRASPLPGNETIKRNASDFYRRDSVNEGERLEFGESLHVELKEFHGTCIEIRLKEVISKYASAFANAYGGYIFIGVTDKEQKVVGCCPGLDEDKLHSHIKYLCAKLKAVHMSGCKKSRAWPPECKLIKVISGKPSEANGYVVAIKILPFCCAVFEKDPDSWHVDGEYVVRLKAAAWLEKEQCADPDGDFCKRFENVVSLQNSPPLCKPVYSIQNLTQLQEKLFPVPKNGVSVVPEVLKDKFAADHDRHLKLATLKGPGICILSQSWAVDIGLLKNEDVMYEALVVCMDEYPTLYCVVKDKDSPELRQYARDTAFHLKQKLVNLGGYTGKLCVIPKLVETQNSSAIECSRLYPNSYRLNQEHDLKFLLRSLVVVLLSFTSPLSDELGCKVFNLLTEKQFEILKMLRGCNRLFIHGVPGSGKTLIAVELIKRIKNLRRCETGNILYISENVGLTVFVRKQDICRCETRTDFMSQSMDFSEVRHIIIDEAQNFRNENGNWYQKAQRLVGQDGILWVFLDYFQKNHRFQDGLPSLSSQQNKVTLCKVVRNSKQVMDAMQSKMVKVVNGHRTSDPTKQFLKDMCNEMELTHSIPGNFRHVPSNNVFETVNEILNDLESEGHSPGAIAVLFSTQIALHADRFKIKTKFPCGNVNNMSPEVLVLDTIRRFSGLERNIIILVNPSVDDYAGNEANFLISAYSRARIRLFEVRQATSPF